VVVARGETLGDGTLVDAVVPQAAKQKSIKVAITATNRSWKGLKA
jgi:hypothetical protein